MHFQVKLPSSIHPKRKQIDLEIIVRSKTIFLLSTLLPTNAASSTSPSAPIREPVHDSSHAAHVSNPVRASTSALTASALQTHGMLNALVQSLTSPLPYGEDGDMVEPDVAFEETGVRLFHTYLVLCGQQLPKEDAETLRTWVKAEQEKEGGEKKLAERWTLDLAELKELVAKLG